MGGGGSSAVSIVTDVRESKFIENATVRLEQDRLIRARVEAHPAVSVK